VDPMDVDFDFDNVVLPKDFDMSSTTVLSTQSTSTCTHRNELLSDELEHVSGILVGT
jgi:hypothetical protein